MLQYSTDWVTSKIDIWDRVVKPLVPRKNILEVGAFEGRATIWFIQNILATDGAITCIDNWSWGETCKSAFMSNTSEIMRGNPTKKLMLAEGDSTRELAKLIVNNCRYDMVYIDGDNLTTARASDAFLAWSMLDVNGIMIFDDYLDIKKNSNIKLAVDSFCNVHLGKFHFLYLGKQVIIQKI